MRYLLAIASASACLVVPRIGAADAPAPVTTAPAPAPAKGKGLSLADAIARAIAGPKVAMAAGDRDAAAARVDEADAARLPKLKASAYATISPEIKCDDPQCLSTSPKNFAFRFNGFFGSAQLDVTQPIYTFGKIAHARSAARAGLDAQRALADETAGDLAVDTARAYWGIKVARELRDMLDDGIDEIDKALKDMKENGAKDLTIQDRQRIAVLVAQARTQRVDAIQGEAQALAGLRALVGDDAVDVDDAELLPIEHELPKQVEVGARPQARAAKAGAVAADALVGAATSAYFPDLAVVGSAVISRAQGVADPPSVFANDPYNREGVGVVLGMQWTIEPWTTKAHVDKARADAKKARAQAELAALGATYDGRVALAEAAAAKDRVAAAEEGEKAARTWLASVLQNQALGLAEPRDLADAYIAWFQMRAVYANAVYAWNVAVVKLDRATGAYHAKV